VEARIQDLVRAKRFGEAIEMAEELRKTWPESAQAKIAEQLIVRLRERLGAQQHGQA
jgi:hypothetical protein